MPAPSASQSLRTIATGQPPVNDINKSAIAVRKEFGVTEQRIGGMESAAVAVAAQAKAMVEARYVMAMQRPRDWDQVRQTLLRECKRPSFANNKSAFYRKPIGNGVEGLGIRFVEVALRCMTNVLIESSMIYEDFDKEVHRVSVTDLESNLTYPQDIRVSKTVERAKPSDDGTYISARMNSYNKPVYTVPATDDDLLNKRAALVSKAIRTLGLRIIPGDLQDEAEDIIKAIRRDEAAKDPDAARKKMVDAYGSINVKASDLVAYLGHSLDSCSPQEMTDLFSLWGAIKDGETTWREVLDNKAQTGGSQETSEDAPKTAMARTAPQPVSLDDLPIPHNAITKQRPAKPAPKQEESGDQEAPAATYASVMGALNDATKQQALDDAATLITKANIPDAEQRKELSMRYQELSGTFGQV